MNHQSWSQRPLWQQLFNMNLGFWGVQVGNGLQTADISAIFESLGAEASQLPLLWLGAPVVGLVVQPLVGQWSDRTWNRWGRRQPYFVAGAVLGSAMLLALPWAQALWQAVAAYWILQFALNICVAPARSFIGDLLPPAHRTLGYAVQGFCIGLGAIAASGLPWILDHGVSFSLPRDFTIPWTIGGAYSIGAVVLIAGTLWTFWTVPEPPPEVLESESFPTPAPAPAPASDASSAPVSHAAATAASNSDPNAHSSRRYVAHSSGFKSLGLQSIAEAIATMPEIMRQLAGVQILTWLGIYCVFLYLPTAIAVNVLGTPNRDVPSYARGVEWAGVCIAFYNLICLGMSLVIPRLSRGWGRVVTHAACLGCGAIGLISIPLVHSRYPLLLCMVGIGIAWASILSIPYALLMDQLSSKDSGVYMGLFNGFVTLPQIAMSLGFGWVMHNLLQENRLAVLVVGGVFLGLAALAMLRVSEAKPKDAPDQP